MRNGRWLTHLVWYRTQTAVVPNRCGDNCRLDGPIPRIRFFPSLLPLSKYYAVRLEFVPYWLGGLGAWASVFGSRIPPLCLHGGELRAITALKTVRN